MLHPKTAPSGLQGGCPEQHDARSGLQMRSDPYSQARSRPSLAALLQIMCPEGCQRRAALAACRLTMKMVGLQQAPL